MLMQLLQERKLKTNMPIVIATRVSPETASRNEDNEYLNEENRHSNHISAQTANPIHVVVKSREIPYYFLRIM